jgi:hypothetical protein
MYYFFKNKPMSAKKKTQSINPKHKPLTPEKLKELSGLNLSDEQAKEIIWSLTKYAQVLYEFTMQQEQAIKDKSKPDSL